MEEKTKGNWQEKIGVVLLALILAVSGYLLIKDNNSAPINLTQNKPTQTAATDSKASNTENKTTTVADTTPTGKISLNKASLEDLDTLPGIGPVLAQRIIDYRRGNGNFKTLEELKEVSGIGEVKFNNVKDLISL